MSAACKQHLINGIAMYYF